MKISPLCRHTNTFCRDWSACPSCSNVNFNWWLFTNSVFAVFVFMCRTPNQKIVFMFIFSHRWAANKTQLERNASNFEQEGFICTMFPDQRNECSGHWNQTWSSIHDLRPSIPNHAKTHALNSRFHVTMICRWCGKNLRLFLLTDASQSFVRWPSWCWLFFHCLICMTIWCDT